MTNRIFRALFAAALLVGCETQSHSPSTSCDGEVCTDACVGDCTDHDGGSNDGGHVDDAGFTDDGGDDDAGPTDDGGTGPSDGCAHEVSTVEGAADIEGSDSAIVIAPDGTAWVSYLDGTNLDLKVARRPAGGAWSTVTVESVGRVGYYSSIALDATGAPWVSYFDDTRRDPKVAHRSSGGAWTTTLIQPRGYAGWHTSIAIDGAGTVWVTYSDYSKSAESLKDIEVAQLPSGGSWTIVDLDRSLPARQADFTDMAIDATGTVWIGYFASPMDGTVKFGTHPAGGAWSKTALDKPEDGVRTPAFTVAPDGTAWLAYTKAGDLKAASRPTGGTWSITTIGTAPALAGEISIATAADGSPWVSYRDDSAALKVAHKAVGGTWLTTTVDHGETAGPDNAITVDADGVAWVTYAATNDVSGTSDVKVAKVVCQ